MSFPKYPEYKHTSVNWLEATPESWNLLQGKRVFSQRKERTFSEDQQLAASQVYGVIPQKKMMEMTGNKVMLALGGTNSFRRVAQDDFVISLRSFEGGIEHSAYNGCVSPAYTVLAPNRTIHPWFYRYLLKSRPYVSALQASTDSLRDGKSITFEQFGVIALPYPSVSEQRQIARFLDHETAKIDTLIHEQKRLIELHKEKRQAVISHAVTKGLDPDVPMKDSGVEWLGEVPAHWACMSFRYATRILRGKFGHRPRNDPALYDGAYPFIQTGDVARAEKYISEFKQTLNEKGAAVSASFPSGTLVMAIAANIGDTAILGFEAYAPDSVVGFQPRQDITLEFLKYSLDSSIQELEKTSTQSTQANLNIDRVGGVKGVFPPEDEQTKIVSFLDKMCEQFSILEKQATKSIALMVERRSALISAAVTGKIDVRDWQPPADESAFDEEVQQAGMEAEA